MPAPSYRLASGRMNGGRTSGSMRAPYRRGRRNALPPRFPLPVPTETLQVEAGHVDAFVRTGFDDQRIDRRAVLLAHRGFEGHGIAVGLGPWVVGPGHSDHVLKGLARNCPIRLESRSQALGVHGFEGTIYSVASSMSTSWPPEPNRRFMCASGAQVQG